MIAKLIRILVVILVVALIVWAILALIPLPGPAATIVEVIAVLIVILAACREFGVLVALLLMALAAGPGRWGT